MNARSATASSQPVRSMTGFGRASGVCDGTDITVEVKSVNHRHLKASFRLPETLGRYESAFEAVVRGAMRRGSVSIGVRMKGARSDSAYTINEARAREFHAKLTVLARQLGLAPPANITDVVELPGVIEMEEPAEGGEDELYAAAAQVLTRALEACNRMRDEEGQALAKDISARCSTLSQLNRQAAAHSPEVVTEYRRRLSERIAKMLQGTDVAAREEDIVREVAFFADRADISEETQRLEQHCHAAQDALTTGGEAGRKLDFIAQEMLREANTMGSKANAGALTALVIEMKSEIEKIKEQVQNIE